ncbi:uncharacterized protein si:ch73-52p7.1 [Clarias gariepinus]|uniref:uncharacterized protein si:ch73-52p7.1 n=1 Tax=Clarias gariepinus TaxID=13013 RepID=UPI00234D2530|nr:uncharacterized protein si:ch73-52p7.1 [Clarias gariepinus]XP_053357425.1 uncharacterized protein si:ch73-52p7.1 [Clarias gariepinus]
MLLIPQISSFVTMTEVNLLGNMGCVALYCVLSLVMPAILHAEFTLANVSEHHITICTCMQDLVACSIINSSECVCHNYPFSMLEHNDSYSTVTYKHLTVWYTSPLHVARLLNNSEVRHLALVKCDSTKATSLTVNYFTVKRLERLSVSYPYWMPGQNHDIVLGRDVGMPYHEEPRIAVIHTDVLVGKVDLKAYTVKTIVDGTGLTPFADIIMPMDELPDTSSIFVSFLY